MFTILIAAAIMLSAFWSLAVWLAISLFILIAVEVPKKHCLIVNNSTTPSFFSRRCCFFIFVLSCKL
jgi:hypothetical protein